MREIEERDANGVIKDNTYYGVKARKIAQRQEKEKGEERRVTRIRLIVVSTGIVLGNGGVVRDDTSLRGLT